MRKHHKPRSNVPHPSPAGSDGIMTLVLVWQAAWQKAQDTGFWEPLGSKAMTPPFVGLLRQGIQTLAAFASS